MASFDNSYSRMVSWLKILLPLTALAILSTLFLVSRSLDPNVSLPFSEDKLQDLAREPKIGNPSFAGVMDNGAAITLSASAARPLDAPQSGLKVTDLSGVLEMPDGQMLDFSASSGLINNTARLLELSQGVTLATSSGYLVKTETIIANLKDSTITTGGSIVADGPLGHISAGQLVLQQLQSNDDKAPYELLFKNGVKLIYIPQQQ